MLGFPEAPRRDAPESSDLIVAQGHIVAISPTEDLKVADYHVAMPYPSGGAVCYDSLAFAGRTSAQPIVWMLNTSNGTQRY